MRLTLTISLCLILCFVVYMNWPEKNIDMEKSIDRILVLKSERKMQVFSQGELLKTYPIALGQEPIGAKEYEGDMKTPEGIYTINDKNPNSAYFLNLGISYPNAEDIAHAESLGKPPGGDIKIHGLKNGMGHIGKLHRQSDWTHGCIAVTNEEMQELFDHVPIGTEIEIRK